MLRIAWVAPFSPKSGVGTFSHYITEAFPAAYAGEAMDVTIIHPPHAPLYASRHRRIAITNNRGFRDILSLFDLIIYNFGNNTEHHELIFALCVDVPGIVILHDYTYQHYLADLCLHRLESPSSYGAVLMKYGDNAALSTLINSRITSKTERPIYGPWDTDYGVEKSCSGLFARLGAAVVVHSKYSECDIREKCSAPILRLGMPSDQKPSSKLSRTSDWARRVESSGRLNLLVYGHIGPTKCLETIISAFSQDPRLGSMYSLVIVGYSNSSAYLQTLEDLVASGEAKGCVHFEVDVSDDKLEQLKERCDLFINLRYPNTEGSSVSLVEQMSFGKPVIVYNGGCYAELEDDAVFKIDQSGGVNALIAKLWDISVDRERIVATGRRGEAIAKEWTCQRYANELLEFWREHRSVIEQRGKIRSSHSRNGWKIDSGPWAQDLASSRMSIALLNLKLLPVDPDLIFSLADNSLATYVAGVVLGLNDQNVIDAVKRHLIPLEPDRRYWKIMHLHVLAMAAYSRDQRFLERASSLRSAFDMVLWHIVLAMPHSICARFASLLVTGTTTSLIGTDEGAAYINFTHTVPGLIARLVRTEAASLRHAPAEVVELLSTLEKLSKSSVNLLSVLEKGLVDFRNGATAIWQGFHDPETNGIWSGEKTSAIIMRLSPRVTGIRVKISVFGCSKDLPRHVMLGVDGTGIQTMVVIEDSKTQVVSMPMSFDADAPRLDSRLVTIKVNCDMLVAPSSMSGSSDCRQLGVFIKSVELIDLPPVDGPNYVSKAVGAEDSIVS